MKVLFDINVVLDIVGKRLPFYEESYLKNLRRPLKARRSCPQPGVMK